MSFKSRQWLIPHTLELLGTCNQHPRVNYWFAYETRGINYAPLTQEYLLYGSMRYFRSLHSVQRAHVLTFYLQYSIILKAFLIISTSPSDIKVSYCFIMCKSNRTTTNTVYFLSYNTLINS